MTNCHMLLVTRTGSVHHTGPTLKPSPHELSGCRRGRLGEDLRSTEFQVTTLGPSNFVVFKAAKSGLVLHEASAPEHGSHLPQRDASPNPCAFASLRFVAVAVFYLVCSRSWEHCVPGETPPVFPPRNPVRALDLCLFTQTHPPHPKRYGTTGGGTGNHLLLEMGWGWKQPNFWDFFYDNPWVHERRTNYSRSAIPPLESNRKETSK